MNYPLKSALVPITLLVMAIALAGPSYATGSVVNVSLWDKGGDAMAPKNLGFAMGADLSKATMGISATPKTVKAGEVTFEVLNSSNDTIHEMIVAVIKDMNQPLLYIEDENEVDEDKYGDLGEVSELDPGKSGALRLDLKPGNYILYCNVPGHCMAGMWTVFTVEP